MRQRVQKDWECVSRAHGLPVGSKEVFNNGAARLLQRVRAGLHTANREAIILIEGPNLRRLFEFTHGSLDIGAKEAAFKDGIAALHAHGGRIVVYVDVSLILSRRFR